MEPSTLTLKSVTVNNNSPIQDYVHPDDQTQPTFEYDIVSHYFSLFAGSLSVTHVTGLLYLFILFSSTSLIMVKPFTPVNALGVKSIWLRMPMAVKRNNPCPSQPKSGTHEVLSGLYPKIDIECAVSCTSPL